MIPSMASPSSTEEVENTISSSTITTVHPDIIQSHILTRLDGPTLASAAVSSSQLRHLCTQHHLWHNICTSMWPSLNDPLATSLISTFPAGYRSIFSDSFPSLHHSSSHQNLPIPSPPPKELISAVDIYYQGKPVFSRVQRTEIHKGWFLCSPLWVDLLDPNELVPTSLKFARNDDDEWLQHLEENLSLSWIVIDPTRKRAANLSSRRPVSVRRHWLTEELEVLYAVVMTGDAPLSTELVKWSIKVSCCGKVGGEMHVREVSLTMEDLEGRHVIGRESMVILQRAMEHGKRKKVDGEEVKGSFEKFCCMKRERRERKLKREKAMDMVAMLVALTIFALLFWFVRFCV